MGRGGMFLMLLELSDGHGASGLLLSVNVGEGEGGGVEQCLGMHGICKWSSMMAVAMALLSEGFDSVI